MKKLILLVVLVSGLFAGNCEYYGKKSKEQLDKVQRANSNKVSAAVFQSELKLNIYYLDKAIVNCEDNDRFIKVREILIKWIK